MAAAPHALRACLLAFRQSIRPVAIARPQPLSLPNRYPQRAFTSTTPRLEEKEPLEEEDDGPREVLNLKRLDEEVLKGVDVEMESQLDQLAKMNNANDLTEYFQREIDQDRANRMEDRDLDESLKKIEYGERPDKSSLWYDDEDPYTHTDEEPFDEDDITSMAHGKLEEVKEMRHYARLAVWEMPLLAKLAKPFEPPTEKQVLRWRYTDYMGDNHPSERKVVVQFAPDDLGLTPVQTSKLKKLAGARYNPDTEIIKMSSESFQHAAQNKAYLSNLVDDLVTAAKDPKDTFEDIPLDTRHHSKKAKPKFPVHWLMTEDRKRALEGAWQQAMLEDGRRAQAGELVDGEQKIESFLNQKLAEQQRLKLQEERQAELVGAAQNTGMNSRNKSRVRR
ncbi:hypothetical protein CC79DRAFT_1184660 [Sarocladium strictum]